MTGHERLDLVRVVRNLPPDVARHLRLALDSGWFEIGSMRWDDGSRVCPIAAAAKVAGYWRDGHCADGGPEWGTETDPAPAVWEFVVAFDNCAESDGLDIALADVRALLDRKREKAAA